MCGLTISTLNLDTEIKENLLREVDFLNREGIDVHLTEKISGKFFFLDCSISDDNDQSIKITHEKILRSYLANIITDLLMNVITKKIMSRIAKNRYQYLNKSELKAIVQNAYNYLNNLHEDGDIGKTLYHHNQILSEVSDYLKSNSNLYLEGFLRFRLKNYFHELETSLDTAVENFVLEQEYNEFIRLLRYFVEVQEPRIDEVHVLIKDKQNFYLLDEDQNPINKQQLEWVLVEFNQTNDYDDLLLSALVTISPRKVVLHVCYKSDIIETIVNIFQERVSICKGCKICIMR